MAGKMPIDEDTFFSQDNIRLDVLYEDGSFIWGTVAVVGRYN